MSEEFLPADNQVEVDPQPAGSDHVDPGTDVGGGETPSYQPNFRYKVMDEEREFPEYIRGIVTDAQREKEIRETYEKAAGIDYVKERRKILEDENKSYKEKWGPIVNSAQALWTLKEKKDFESLFESLGIPEEDLFGYVHNRLQLRENPDQLKQHTQYRQLEQSNQQLKAERDFYLQQQQEIAARQKALELDYQLSKPDVQAAVQDFDARLGQAGAFKDELVRRADYAYRVHGKDLSAEEAVQEMLRFIGVAPQSQAVGAPVTGVVQPRQTPATLPNIQGQGSSPAKKAPRSTEDLRKLARKMGNF